MFVGMKIAINNVAVINQALLDCRGVSLITGKNGSGKSTIGKVIASIAAAMNNDKEIFIADCVNYFYKTVGTYYNDLYFYYIRIPFMIHGNIDIAHPSEEDRLRFSFISDVAREKPFKGNFEGLMDYAYSLVSNLENNSDYFLQYVEKYSKPFQGKRFSISLAKDVYQACIDITKEAIKNLEKYQDNSNYLYVSIQQELNYTFHGQFLPIGGDRENSFITIDDDGDLFAYHHNSYEKSKITNISSLKNTFYISDGCLLDQIDSHKKKVKGNGKDGFSPSVSSLDGYLLEALNKKKNIVTQNSIINDYPAVFSIIDSVWPHSTLKQKGITINSDTGINISNEASGAKIFILLKILLANGSINKDSLLIFDEPENHLHPEWQSVLAKLLIVMNKYIGCKILCITHSPNLLFAMDVMSKKYQRRDFLTIYFSNVDNGQYEIIDCTNKIEKAHMELVKPYIKLDIEGE